MQCPICGHMLSEEDIYIKVCSECKHKHHTNEVYQENNRLMQELKELDSANTTLTRALFHNNEQLVNAFISQVDAQDKYTGQHSRRVAMLSVQIGKLLNFKHNVLLQLEKSAHLHDIGKAYVNEVILNKSGKLTEEEMNVMKKHPVKGVELIKHIDLFSYAVDVIHYHHERWDGKGYPDGLKEMEIPYWARIVAIADATDAMMLERPYRPALHRDKIIHELKNNAGIQFDPMIIEEIFKSNKDGVFFKIMERGE